MCLILFALHTHPKYKLILAANRDEFFNRETQFAHFWDNSKNILAGKDMASGGTWMGVQSKGRFIAITNYRHPEREILNPQSRGSLSRQFLADSETNKDFIGRIAAIRNQFNGYNLLLSDDGLQSMVHYSNITNVTTSIKKGIHGLSNALLDSAWPKVESGKRMLSEIVSSSSIYPEQLISILNNHDTAPDHLLPNTGISTDLEKKLSPVFISMKGYGTRCSTALLVDKKDDVIFHEVSYNEQGEVISKIQHQLHIKY
jgi:uncharacterized protein with NRDE domain